MVQDPQAHLTSVIHVVVRVCKSMGWTIAVPDEDEITWRHAMVAANRYGTRATIEIFIDDVGVVEFETRVSHGHSDMLPRVIQRIREDARKLGITLKAPPLAPKAPSASVEPITTLLAILHRFHVVAEQLAHRREARPTLTITDEYDVQDLLHALLRSAFDDVRPEDSVPSYAGGASRVDFVLKAEKIVVETKFVRPALKAKDIGEQLIVDIGKYKGHADCKTLVFLVYDPEHRLLNPRGFEADLTKVHDGVDVRVLIVPT